MTLKRGNNEPELRRATSARPALSWQFVLEPRRSGSLFFSSGVGSPPPCGPTGRWCHPMGMTRSHPSTSSCMGRRSICRSGRDSQGRPTGWRMRTSRFPPAPQARWSPALVRRTHTKSALACPVDFGAKTPRFQSKTIDYRLSINLYARTVPIDPRF